MVCREPGASSSDDADQLKTRDTFAARRKRSRPLRTALVPFFASLERVSANVTTPTFLTRAFRSIQRGCDNLPPVKRFIKQQIFVLISTQLKEV
jgi:hypothetical protein